MITFRIEVTQAGQRTIEALAGLGEALARIPAQHDNFAEIGNSIRAGFAQNFDREQAGDLYPWADLAKSTQTERILLGYPPAHPILERSGSYKSTFTDAGDPLHYAEFEMGAWGFRVEIGSEDPRAPLLEHGDDERLPARSVAVLSSEATDHLSRTLHELILATLEESL